METLASTAVSSARLEISNPATGGAVGSVPVTQPDEVTTKVARLRRAQPEWQAIGFEERSRWIEQFGEWILANHLRLADLLQAETGKVRAEADYEGPTLVAAIQYWAKHGAKFLAEEHPRASFPLMKSKKLRLLHRPYPVVGVIGPWNLPLLLPVGDLLPALFAGCTVVVKPSEVTPLAIAELVRGWREEVGAPDVLDIAQGGAETGAAVVDECDFIQFTGSVRTGKLIAKRAAETLTPVSLELGGKDPMLVLAGANVDRAVNAAAWGGLANSGQVCMAVERVYVEEPVYDEFVSGLVERVGQLQQGYDGPAYEADVGAMTFARQTATVEAHVADAIEKGARVLVGGRQLEGEGDFYEPTVIVDVDHTMKIMREETFGPVIPVMKAANGVEAVRLANDSDYGLSASVFASSVKEGIDVARLIDAGAVNINDVYTNTYVMDLPFGGWKQSGIGSRNGPGGIRKYCRGEAIVSSRIPLGKSDPLWFPYGGSQRAFASRLFGFFISRGLRRRLAAIRGASASEQA